MEVARRNVEPFFLERPRLGDLLVRKGLITSTQLAQALVDSRVTGELLGRTLIRAGYLFEDELARTLADQLNVAYVDLAVLGIDLGLARLIPLEDGRRAAAIPVAAVAGSVRVAFADPCDETARDIVERHISAPLEIAVGELSAIESSWRRVERLTTRAAVSLVGTRS